jgi:putative oxidoreductase
VITVTGWSPRITGLLLWAGRSRVLGRAARAAAALRILAGLMFLLAAIPKIAAHQNEIDEFVRFGFPRSSLLVWLVTLLEIGGGLLLVAGLATRVAAAALALNMTGALLTAGVRVGGPIHLGLGPALLLAMLCVLWAGPGAAALDQRWESTDCLPPADGH